MMIFPIPCFFTVFFFQAELIAGIKAASTCILDHNGVIKSFENLGLRRLPLRLTGNDMQDYREGQYV